MSRLTGRLKDGRSYLIDDIDEDKYGYTTEKGYEQIDRLIDYIAQYEDLGTVEELSALKAENAALTERLKSAVELPCKVGDTVYEANWLRNMISIYEIISVTITKFGINYDWELKEGIYTNIKGFSDYAFGKTVFLNRTEAEVRLKELEEKYLI